MLCGCQVLWKFRYCQDALYKLTSPWLTTLEVDYKLYSQKCVWKLILWLYKLLAASSLQLLCWLLIRKAAISCSLIEDIYLWQGDKLRRRHDWKRWIMPSSVPLSSISGPQSPGLSNPENLTTQIQGISMEEKTADISNATEASSNVTGRLSSGDLNGHPQQLSGGDGTSQVSI